MGKKEVLKVFKVLKRCRPEDIRDYGKSVLERHYPPLLDITKVHDSLVRLSREGLVKRNPDGTWEVVSRVPTNARSGRVDVPRNQENPHESHGKLFMDALNFVNSSFMDMKAGTIGFLKRCMG